jgi:hypothetical protein
MTSTAPVQYLAWSAAVLLMRLAVPGQAATDRPVWDDRFYLPGIQGAVYAIAVSGADVYVSGSFTSADSVAATNIAKWDGTHWSALGGGINGVVNALAVQGNHVYAGGAFSAAGEVSAKRVARWDGTNWSALGSGIGSNTVYALALSGSGLLYVAGEFATAGEVNAKNVAQWDGSQWSALGAGVSDIEQSYAWAVAVMGNDLYVGGYFTEAGGAPADNLARWNGASWSAVGGGMNDPDYPAQVSALAVDGPHLYVGGAFSSAGSVSAGNIARWDGASWSALGDGLERFYGDLPVTTLAVNGHHLLVGGRFVSAGGVSANNLAEWDGTRWTGLDGGATGRVKALAAGGTDLYVGGSFTVTNVSIPVALARWNGAEWSAISTGGGQGFYGQDDSVAALAVSDSIIYAGGSFTAAGGVQVSNVAQWNGAHWSPLGSGVNGSVDALALSGSDLFVGGKFTAAGGVAVSNIARWDGLSWWSLGSGCSGSVNALGVNGGQLYAGGAFATAGGVSASNVACWNGTTWSALGSGINGPVYALGVSGSNLFVGGRFTVAGGIAASNVARWNGTSWSALGSGVGGVVSTLPRVRPPPVSALLVNGSDLYVAGDFAFAGGVGATNLARWDGTNWFPLGSGVLGLPSMFPSPAARALAVSGGGLYVGGTFSQAGGLPTSNLAKWDGTQWMPLGGGVGLGVNVPPSVAALALSEDTLYVGGHFRFAGGEPASDFAMGHLSISLTIARVDDAVRISWPAAARDFVLQTTESLSSVSWMTMTNTPIVVGDQQTVTDDRRGLSQFYRLLRR